MAVATTVGMFCVCQIERNYNYGVHFAMSEHCNTLLKSTTQQVSTNFEGSEGAAPVQNVQVSQGKSQEHSCSCLLNVDLLNEPVWSAIIIWYSILCSCRSYH